MLALYQYRVFVKNRNCVQLNNQSMLIIILREGMATADLDQMTKYLKKVKKYVKSHQTIHIGRIYVKRSFYLLVYIGRKRLKL